MGGFSKIFCISGEVYENYESVHSVQLFIFAGEGNRQWYEPHYVSKNIKPIGKIHTIIPAGVNDENSLLDACIAFAPKLFDSCPTLKKIQAELEDSKSLSLVEDEIPNDWKQLRREAAPIFETLNVSKIEFIPLNTDQRYLGSDNKKDLKNLR